MKTAILDILERRSAWRAFSSQPVEEEKLLAVLEAARLSASCMNNQSWRFLVLTEPEALEKGRAALTGGNYWAKAAPVLLIGFSRPDFDCQMPEDRNYFLFDLGMATQNILLQATELGLVARPMAGFFPEKAREAFGIPDGYTVMVFIAVGYKGDLAVLSEKHQKISTAQRVRRELGENFFMNRFEPGK